MNGTGNGDRGGTSTEERRLMAQSGLASERRQGRFGSFGMPAERSEDLPAAMRRLGQLLGRERWRMVVVLVLTVVSVGLVVIGPWLLGQATDVIVRGATSPEGLDHGALHRRLMVVAALYAIAWVLAYAQARMLAGVVHRSMYRLRESLEAKLNRLPLGWVDRQPRGDLLSRVTNDVDNLAQSLQQSASQLITSTLTVIGVAVMMFVISPLLAAVALGTVPLAAWGMKRIAARARPRYLEQWRHTGSLNAQVEEAITGHAIVKSFGRQPDVEQAFSERNEQLHRASFRAQFTSSLIQPLMVFVGNVQYLLVAVVGGLRVSSGAISIGDVQALIQYSRQSSQPLSQLASLASVFQSGMASLERLLELLDADEEVPDPPAAPSRPHPGPAYADPTPPSRPHPGSADADPTPPSRPHPGVAPPSGRVEMERVRFSYEPDRPLIEELSLVAEPGQTIAIVGPTGAGKTTLVNLIMRFYELDGGRILLDGTDIAQLPRRQLRSSIGMVLQDTWLFGGTIRENLAYGDPRASEEQILDAARLAYVDRFVRALPDGYDTVIDDEGGNISAGEKQLITIARAFLADPSVLILDEATSSVDTRTEILIQRAMAALRHRRTSFVIAHRLSTIRGADLIVVMEDGRIVEQGSHAELLEHRGSYHRLYQSQFAGAATDDA